MVDGHLETSQSGQASSEQRHPTHPVPNGDLVVAECDLDLVFNDVH